MQPWQAPVTRPSVDRSLDILYVGTLPPHPGGSAVSGAGLLQGLSALGHSLRAVAPITADAQSGGDVFAERHPRLHVRRFPVRYFETSPDSPAPDDYHRAQGDALRRLLPELIEAKRPDVVFVGRETFAWEVPDIAAAHGVPAVVRLAGGTTLGILNGAYPPPMGRALLDRLRRVQCLVSPAHHLAARLEALGTPPVTVIPNAVDTDLFTPGPKSAALLRRLALRDDDIVVAHVSNLKSIKRPLDVVQSARLALQHDPRLVYVVIGDGTLRRPMEEACRDAGLWNRFRFVGWIDYPEMPPYFRLADLVLMPSADEGLARVYLETQACGRVLIASDIPAAREVVVHGETGLLFPAGDLAALAEATLKAAADPGLRADVGQRARERSLVHALPSAVARYAEVFREVAAAALPGPATGGAGHRTP